MAVLRESKGTEFTAQDTRRYSQQDLQVQPVRPNGTVSVGSDDDWKGRLLQSLTGSLMPLAKQYTETTQMERYLEGQAKAGQIGSEQEIQGNPLTRDWEVAGYRDVMGKLQIADTDAQMAVDMKLLREQSPEKMQEYLAERRAAVSPNLASMSRDQRGNAFGQLLMSDRAAITKHTAEHSAFILDQKVRPIRESAMVGLTALQDARTKASMDPAQYKGAYSAQLDSVVANIATNMWNDPTLPLEVKQKFTVETLQHALDTGGVDVYNYFNNTQLDMPNGQKMRVLSMLDEKDTVKLSNQFKAAMQETSLDRNMNELNRKADIEAQIKAGTYTGTQDDVQRNANAWRAAGIFRTQEAYEGHMQAFASMRSGQADESRLASAFLTGHTQELANLNKTPQEALEAVEKRFSKLKLPLHERAAQLLNVGDQHGMADAYKAVGKYLGPAMMQLGNADGSINADNKALFDTVNSRITAAEASGNQKAYTDLLDGMTDAQKKQMLTVRAYIGERYTVEEALRKTATDQAKYAAMDPSMRAALAPARDEISKALESYDSQGTIMKNIRGLWDSTKGALAPNETPWFEDSRLAERQVSTMRGEILIEASNLSMTNPGMSADSLITYAASNVQGRTVGTSQGPITLPRGTSLHSYFGVAGSVPKERIGTAIDTMLKPSQSGNHMEFEATPQGMRFREITPNGERTPMAGILDAKSVSTAVNEEMQQEADRANKVYGTGARAKSNGVNVIFNGENSVAMQDTLMYQFRKNLVQNENYSAVMYDDKTGKPVRPGQAPQGTLTVGVGLTGDYIPKKGPDGRIGEAALNDAFKRASNDAGAAGLRAADASGLRSDSAILLFSELGYQSGTGFLQKFKSYQDTVKAMQTGNALAAQEQFKSTPAYKVSGPERQKHYLDLIQKATKGT